MDSQNISKSILSAPPPGTHLVPGENASARKLARNCNLFVADAKKRHPDRFGYWASLPLPDVEGSLTELAYALDELDADGVNLFTNTHGIYLGDPSFEPLFCELNNRGTIVMFHPSDPIVNTNSSLHSASPLKYPMPVMEYYFETARAIVNLFLTGTIDRYPNITYIIPHAGGAFPSLIERFPSIGRLLGTGFELGPEEVKNKIKSQFYFDLTGYTFPDQISGLLPLVSSSQLLYGSDFPYLPPMVIADLAKKMEHGLQKSFPDKKKRQAVYSGNAKRLLDGKIKKISKL